MIILDEKDMTFYRDQIKSLYNMDQITMKILSILFLVQEYRKKDKENEV